MMKRCVLLGLVVAGLALARMSAASANQIVNGGFEEPTFPTQVTTYEAGDTSITGWTVRSGDVDLVRASLWPAFEGDHSLDMDGLTPGSIEQVFPTTIGQQYSLTFHYGNNPRDGSTFPATATVEILSNPTATALLSANLTHGNSTTPDMNYSPFSNGFTAISTTTTLRFTSNDPGGSTGGIVLDAVAVDSVPEPSSLGLLTCGAVGLTIRRRRRVKRGRS